MNRFLSEFNFQAWRLIRRYESAKMPDVTLIYGPYGVGKSSLLRHIYQQNGKREDDFLVGSKAFTSQYVFAAQDNKLHLFRKRYRSARLLLLDDLQYLAGKQKTIEELQSTYEAVIENGGKIIATLEAATPQLGFLGDRLASRFLGGMVVPILTPSSRELEHFICEFTRREEFYLEPEVVSFIAERASSLTEVLSIIEQFIHFSEAKQGAFNLGCIQEFWQQEEQRSHMAAEPLNIIRRVAQAMDIPEEALTGPSRKPEVCQARGMAIHLIRTLCNASYPVIAGYFQRSHSTIMASCKKLSKKMVEDRDLEKKYQQILKMFESLTVNKLDE